MKVLLIDDHPLILTALRNVIEGVDRDVSVHGVPGGRSAREALAANPGYDLFLLDLNLQDCDGFELLAELRRTHPSVPLVVVSATDRGADVIRAIDLGAMGFVSKRSGNDTLQEALNVVMKGGIYVPHMTLGDGFVEPNVADGTAHEAPAGSAAGSPGPLTQREALARFKLTPRQTDVLGLLLRGQSNKLIARELNLSVETVKDHVAAVLRQLNVNSRTQAVLAVGQLSGQSVFGGLGLPERPAP